MAAKPHGIQMTKALSAAASRELVRVVSKTQITEQRRKVLAGYGLAARNAFALPVATLDSKK